MSKKKKKKNKHFSSDNSGIYNSERNKQIAKSLKGYIETYDEIFIPEGISVKRKKRAEEIIREAIKNLKNNKPEEVFDMDAFEEYSDTLGYYNILD